MALRLRIILATLLFGTNLVRPAVGQNGRAMNIDDLFKLQQIGQVAMSPDGAWVAVVIQREGAFRGFGLDRADIWLMPWQSGSPRNLTNGAVDGSSSWNPVWSPDSRRIALLSTKGGNNVRLHVWDLASHTLRRLAARGVDLDAGTDERWPGQPIVWIDSTTVLCPVLPEGERPPLFFGPVEMQVRATGEWAKTTSGRLPAVSVLESGREIPARERPQGQLLVVNTRTGVGRVAVDGTFRLLLISPNRRTIALIADVGRVPPRPDRRIPIDVNRESTLLRTRLAVLPLSPGGRPIWVDGIHDPAVTDGDGRPVPHRWSRDGSTIAVIGKEQRSDPYAATVYVVAASGNGVKRLTDRTLDAARAVWSGAGTLVVSARPTSYSTPGADTTRRDWWRLDPRGKAPPRRISEGMAEVPSDLVRAPEGDAMLGVASGALWSLDVRSGRRKTITSNGFPAVQSIAWSRGSANGDVHRLDVIIETTKGGLYRVQRVGSTLQVSPFRRPSSSATLAGIDGDSRHTVFTSAERSGTHFWTRDGTAQRFEERIALNRHLSLLPDAKRVLIRYRGVEGDSLLALVVLPVGYEPGKRYPLITWVYGGVMVTDTLATPLIEKQTVSPLNLHLLPSHGYALLIPSMPLSSRGVASDPMSDIPKGVLPAVDRAVALGIADPRRLGVMGISYGGYSTYSLVTYTHRFQAAVALAGPADLPSAYGEIFAERRYADFAHELLYNQGGFESGQMRMGDPPWNSLWRYLRNSPYFFANRVSTPLMIIQGDVDFISMLQGEEFFTALYRMGKPAVFVRYWGEGHVVGESEANVRDMWRRIFMWFDEHLKISAAGHTN